ncbi:MAG: hypothetical protein M3O15_14500 [Acidobacteriota bacterium]|nr:hypothetical protein [Acidobacteriota bacterium]
MPSFRLPHWKLSFALVALLTLPPVLHADDTVGAHFGFVLPIATRAGGHTTTLSDEFKIGFPTGITIKTKSRFAFDLELVPLIHGTSKLVDLTVHPGVLYSLGGPYTAGLRAAFDVNQQSWGFTPLFNIGFPQANGTTLFGELDLPVRFQKTTAGSNQTALTAAVHLGWAF